MRTALICVLIAGLMPYLWTSVAKVLGPRYDNRNVREWQSRRGGRLQRTRALEAFPFFASAVLSAIVAAHADMQRVAMLSIALIVTRLVYA